MYLIWVLIIAVIAQISYYSNTPVNALLTLNFLSSLIFDLLATPYFLLISLIFSLIKELAPLIPY